MEYRHRLKISDVEDHVFKSLVAASYTTYKGGTYSKSFQLSIMCKQVWYEINSNINGEKETITFTSLDEAVGYYNGIGTTRPKR